MHVARRYVSAGVATLLALLLWPGAAGAQPTVDASPVPICDGGEEAAAQEASKLGKELYRAALMSQPPSEAKLWEALAQFDRQCASGDDWALELRASTLLLLGRPLEAARNLDAFLAGHPMATLPADGKLRVAENQKIIFGKVGTLLILTNAHQPELTLDAAPATPLTSPLRVAPGEHAVRLSARGFRPSERTVSVQAGGTVELDMRLELVTGREVEQAEHIPALKVVSELPVDRAGQRRKKLLRWAVATGVVALSGAGLGIAGMSSAFAAANDYDEQGCTRGTSPRCEDSETKFDRGLAMEVAGLTVAGVMAAASVTLFVVRGRSPDRPATTVTGACGPAWSGGPQLACAGRF